jgi:hypothetical protein
MRALLLGSCLYEVLPWEGDPGDSSSCIIHEREVILGSWRRMRIGKRSTASQRDTFFAGPSFPALLSSHLLHLLRVAPAQAQGGLACCPACGRCSSGGHQREGSRGDRPSRFACHGSSTCKIEDACVRWISHFPHIGAALHSTFPLIPSSSPHIHTASQAFSCCRRADTHPTWSLPHPGHASTGSSILRWQSLQTWCRHQCGNPA